jgi:integrase
MFSVESAVPDAQDDDKLITVPVAAGIMGFEASYIYELARRGRLPSVRHGKWRQLSVRAMTLAQRDAFLVEAQNEPTVYFVLYLLLIRAGLRPGEAYALEVEDLDLAARKIHVDKALSMGEVGPTKTGTRRAVDMSQELTGILRDFLIWRQKEKLRLGLAEMPPTVFFNECGRPLDESRVRKHFTRALKRAGLSAFRVYDCRHTYASLLLNAGAPITFVSWQLGHSKPTTTLQFYAHFLPSGNEHRFVDALDRVPEHDSDPNLAPSRSILIDSRDRESERLTTTRKSPRFPRGFSSGPRVTRTLDPLIKRLCKLVFRDHWSTSV